MANDELQSPETHSVNVFSHTSGGSYDGNITISRRYVDIRTLDQKVSSMTEVSEWVPDYLAMMNRRIKEE